VSPRPRKVTDEDVYAATHRAMQRLAPNELTLAEIGAEAGVTAGALAQRFGSKRELLLGLTRAYAASSGEFIQQLRAAHKSPLAAIRAYAECMAGLAQSPAGFARSLAYLQIDLADPDFREQLAIQAKATRAGLTDLLNDALAARELKRGTDVGRLARTVEAMVSGSLMTWAFYSEGPADRWIRDDVNAVLAPYVRT
jgi:AcrR family transcriptional regulator